jgi:hypothetical protein
MVKYFRAAWFSISKLVDAVFGGDVVMGRYHADR